MAGAANGVCGVTVMTGLRVMTYNVNGGGWSRKAPEVNTIAQVISEAAPDVVALQGVDVGGDHDQLGLLSKLLGMRAYGVNGKRTNAFLSYYPLRGFGGYALGAAGRCLRAEVDISQKRMYLYNILIAMGEECRHQFETLLGEDLLGSHTAKAPALALGDFGPLCSALPERDSTLLQRVTNPLLHRTYPANLPLFARDRAYVQGDLRILSVEVVGGRVARRAARHLPLLVTVRIVDPRIYLEVENPLPQGYEIAPG